MTIERTYQDIERVMGELDKWVLTCGSGRYSEEHLEFDEAFFALPENFGIQQIRAEIKEFATMVLSRKDIKKILEIGFGYYGSTHFLWRQIADQVTSIDYQQSRINAFGENMRKFYGKWVLDDKKSSFIYGKSAETSVLKKTYSFLKDGVDLLFIDGDHRYEGVMADFLLYAPLVRPGGIIAFHDAIAQADDFGVPQFLKELSEGKIGGKKYKFNKIVHSKSAGIAYCEI